MRRLCIPVSNLPADSAFARAHQQQRVSAARTAPRTTSTPAQFRAAGGAFVYAPRSDD